MVSAELKCVGKTYGRAETAAVASLYSVQLISCTDSCTISPKGGKHHTAHWNINEMFGILGSAWCYNPRLHKKKRKKRNRRRGCQKYLNAQLEFYRLCARANSFVDFICSGLTKLSRCPEVCSGSYCVKKQKHNLRSANRNALVHRRCNELMI